LTVASCAPTIANAVAEMVIGELILGLRRALQNAAANRADSNLPLPPFGKVLSSSTVGVVGASTVGRRVIAFLQTFSPEILLSDPFVGADEAAHLNVRKVDDLVMLCAASDAVTLHTPLLPATTHLLEAEHFQAMRDDAVFVNTSRGGCIDEEALINELQKGRLQAFLDVSEPEPAVPDSPLRSLPNVVYTSHIAGEAETGIGDQVVSDIAAWLRGEAPQMVITAEMLAMIA
jgi:phosphoglycerate dehydrogenase-like enzyme